MPGRRRDWKVLFTSNSWKVTANCGKSFLDLRVGRRQSSEAVGQAVGAEAGVAGERGALSGSWWKREGWVSAA